MKPKPILTRTASVLAVLLAALLSGACSSFPLPRDSAPPLRVGFTPNYPPICMEIDGLPAGLEFDLANALARELGRPLELVECRWQELIDAQLSGQTDILMAGLTATPARSARLRFCIPYMVNPLVAMCRAGEPAASVGADELLQTTANIGVMARTSAEAFAKHHFPHARVIGLSDRSDAAINLMNRRIDYYIDDFAAIEYIISENESQLAFLPYPLQGQNLCWAVRPDQDELRRQCDETIARWKKSGELDRMLDRWLPSYKDLVR
jgi:polar amino acid transport system substrate-binding protein